MLINSNSDFKKDDIITIKNILGEEIICKYISEDSTSYTVNRPIALGMSQQGMQFIPPVVSGEVDGDMKFQKAHAMWVTLTQSEIQSAYVQQTTGLAVPTKGKIQV